MVTATKTVSRPQKRLAYRQTMPTITLALVMSAPLLLPPPRSLWLSLLLPAS
jgi:hypothetical protein